MCTITFKQFANFANFIGLKAFLAIAPLFFTSLFLFVAKRKQLRMYFPNFHHFRINSLCCTSNLSNLFYGIFCQARCSYIMTFEQVSLCTALYYCLLIWHQIWNDHRYFSEYPQNKTETDARTHQHFVSLHESKLVLPTPLALSASLRHLLNSLGLFGVFCTFLWSINTHGSYLKTARQIIGIPLIERRYIKQRYSTFQPVPIFWS